MLINFIMLKLGYHSPEVQTVFKLWAMGNTPLAISVAKEFSGQYISENHQTMEVIAEMLERNLNEAEVFEKIAYYLTRHVDTGFEYAKARKTVELTEEFNTKQDFYLS